MVSIYDIVDILEIDNIIVYDYAADVSRISLRLIFLCHNNIIERYNNEDTHITKIILENHSDSFELQEIMSTSYKYRSIVDDIEFIVNKDVRKDYDSRGLSIGPSDDKLLVVIFNDGTIVGGSY